jgi:hypothetical protein
MLLGIRSADGGEASTIEAASLSSGLNYGRRLAGIRHSDLQASSLSSAEIRLANQPATKAEGGLGAICEQDLGSAGDARWLTGGSSAIKQWLDDLEVNLCLHQLRQSFRDEGDQRALGQQKWHKQLAFGAKLDLGS